MLRICTNSFNMSLITEHNHVVKRCLLLLLAGAESSDGLVNCFVSHQQTKYFLKTFRVALRIGFNLDKIIINVSFISYQPDDP